MEVKATPHKACAVLPKIKRRFIYMKIETKCLHEGYHPKNTEPRVVPIVQSTTYVYDSTDDVAAVFDDPIKPTTKIIKASITTTIMVSRQL